MTEIKRKTALHFASLSISANQQSVQITSTGRKGLSAEKLKA